MIRKSAVVALVANTMTTLYKVPAHKKSRSPYGVDDQSRKH